MPPWLEQIDELIGHHLPAEVARVPDWPIVVALLLGLVLSLAGARVLRTGAVVAFGLAGAWIGQEAAARFGFSTVLGVACGFFVLAVVGYLVFRLWVAAVTGAVALVVTAGLTGGASLPGVWQEFERHRLTGGHSEEFVLLSPDEQRAVQRIEPGPYMREFGEWTRARHPELARRVAFASVAAFVGGLVLGLVAWRWAAVLGTVVGGTALLLVAGLFLAGRYWPAALESVSQNPRVALGGLCAWLVLCVLVQRGSLRAPVISPPPAGPDKA